MFRCWYSVKGLEVCMADLSDDLFDILVGICGRFVGCVFMI